MPFKWAIILRLMADHDGGVIKQQIPQIKMDPPSVDNSSPSPPKVSELIKGSVDI